MPAELVERLEAWKARFGDDPSPLHTLLEELGAARITDAQSLIRLHECLLFLRAYPADAKVVRLAGKLLATFAQRVDELPDLSAFEEAEVSGIASTSFSAVFSYEVARQLAARYPDIEIDWENYEHVDKLGPVLARLLPMAGEDWPVEAHVPYRRWLDAVKPANSSALAWLLSRIKSADVYESLDLLLLWRIGDAPAARTHTRLPVGKPFYHRQPLLRRADISLTAEFDAPPLPIMRFSNSEARRILDLILDTSAVRYRELHGFSHPDTRRVFRADAGRGVEIVFFGVPPEWRLPLRAYHCGMFFKNGVPSGYVELLSICDRAEVGFNLYYTFREGESAWIYARLLRLFRQILGVRYFSVDPYQIGQENDEAVDSGAFWFYRKLGFRPLDPDAARLVAREEIRMLRRPGYRSSRATLRKLARSYLLYECADAEPGIWDRFRIRTLALRCANQHPDELLRAIANEAIIRAKKGPDEARYLRLMQKNRKLRDALIAIGSTSTPPA